MRSVFMLLTGFANTTHEIYFTLMDGKKILKEQVILNGKCKRRRWELKALYVIRKSFNTEAAGFYAMSAQFEALYLLEVAEFNENDFSPMYPYNNSCPTGKKT